MKIFIFILSVLLSNAYSSLASENAPQPQTKNPRMLVHLLSYLAKDYGGAVSHGKIISKEEFQEQVEFSEKVTSIVQSLNANHDYDQEFAAAQNLEKNIKALSDEERISSLANLLQKKILEKTKLEQFPLSWPKLSRAKKIYEQACTSCHGFDGHGDGPAAASLEPKPANFHNVEAMQNLSPFQAYNTIRMGVPGTSMPAHPQLSDQDVWDVAFYILSLRHGTITTHEKPAIDNALEIAATTSDRVLDEKFNGSDKFRLYEEETSAAKYVAFTKATLKKSKDNFDQGNYDQANEAALQAYLEGVEPIEPQLRARYPSLKTQLEKDMEAFRSAVKNKNKASIETALDQAFLTLEEADEKLSNSETSPWLVFSLTSGILLREAFEAVLMLIALLSVIKATGNARASRYVHYGWIAAVLLGVVTWFFSGWAAKISGASRELLEGTISLFAVSVLVCLGFWLHSQTEIHRWKNFIDKKVKGALNQGNLFAIAMISFFAVFREAFEVVLFLRAIVIDAGPQSYSALLTGVVVTFSVVLLLSWIMLKFSARLPIRKIFSVSSILMTALAVILTGKAFHSLQETGIVSATSLWPSLRIELIGLFPTLETLLSQIVILSVCIILWMVGKRAPARHTAHS